MKTTKSQLTRVAGADQPPPFGDSRVVLLAPHHLVEVRRHDEVAVAHVGDPHARHVVVHVHPGGDLVRGPLFRARRRALVACLNNFVF